MSFNSSPSATAANESFVNASSGAYMDEMYDSWSRDPTSVHASWDAYFRGVSYTPPPGIGNTKANEIPLSAIGKKIILSLIQFVSFHVISYHFLSIHDILYHFM